MSAHGATPAEVLSAEQEINNKAYAAKARAQVVRIFGHCTKDQHVCLVMPSNEKFLVTVVEGEPTDTQLHVKFQVSVHVYVPEYEIKWAVQIVMIQK